MNFKSETCVGRNNRSLTLYYTKSEADDGARYAKSTYHKEMVSYKCSSCGYYHLAPANRNTPLATKRCNCVDRNGSSKDLYISKSSAEKRAKILLSENGVKLSVYKCVEERGYHLSKDKR